MHISVARWDLSACAVTGIVKSMYQSPTLNLQMDELSRTIHIHGWRWRSTPIFIPRRVIRAKPGEWEKLFGDRKSVV